MAYDQLYEVKCSNCGHSEVCGTPQMLAKLRDRGMFRREKEPDPVVVQELFAAQATEMVCSQCLAPAVDVVLLSDLDDQDWGQARICTRCGSPIPLERLEVFPDAVLCTDCQQAADRGVDDNEP